jgi:hypothetical protein
MLFRRGPTDWLDVEADLLNMLALRANRPEGRIRLSYRWCPSTYPPNNRDGRRTIAIDDQSSYAIHHVTW